MDSKVKVRYFTDWANEGPAIFFSADSSSVKRLEVLFRQFASGEIDIIYFDSLDFIESYFGIDIAAAAGIQDRGIEKTGGKFEWIVTRAEWEKYADMLSAFSDNSKGHQYLDTGAFYIYHMQIIVSVNEYASDWSAWKEE